MNLAISSSVPSSPSRTTSLKCCFQLNSTEQLKDWRFLSKGASYLARASLRNVALLIAVCASQNTAHAQKLSTSTEKKNRMTHRNSLLSMNVGASFNSAQVKEKDWGACASRPLLRLRFTARRTRSPGSYRAAGCGGICRSRRAVLRRPAQCGWVRRWSWSPRGWSRSGSPPSR